MKKSRKNEKRINIERIKIIKEFDAKAVGSKLTGSAQTQMKGFLDFLGQNSILALALGVIIGSATKDVVNQLVAGILTPLITVIISLFSKDLTFNSLNITVRGVPILLGDFLNAVLTMVLIMLILYIVFGVIFKKQEALGIKEKENKS